MLTIYYDGDCPFCNRYVQLIELRDAVGEVELVDLRAERDKAQAFREQGLDPNQGMIVVYEGEQFHGHQATQRLAELATPATPVSIRLLRSPSLAKFSYPILRTGRNLTLKLLGRKPIP